MNEDAGYRPREELRHDWLALVLIVLMLAMGAFAFPDLPARVAIHFGVNGQPNGWASPLFAVLFPPAMTLGVWLLVLVLPTIDPRRRNYAAFARFYRAMRLAIVLLLFALDAATLWRGLGHAVNIRDVVILLVSALMIFLGNSMSLLRNNWFVGIRTPWTLSSEEVWRLTHRFGSRIFVLAGLLPIATFAFSTSLAAALLLAGVLVAAVGSVVYSYVVFARISR